MRTLIKWGIVAAVAMLLVGCGSKKKITSYHKGYEITNEAKKSASEERSIKTSTDTSKKKTKVSEGFNQRVVEEFIFDKDGRPTSYRKTTETSGTKESESTENKNVSETETTDKNTSSEETRAVDKKEVIKEKDIQKKHPWPVWWFVGAGVFVVIVIWVRRKFF